MVLKASEIIRRGLGSSRDRGEDVLDYCPQFQGPFEYGLPLAGLLRYKSLRCRSRPLIDYPDVPRPVDQGSRICEVLVTGRPCAIMIDGIGEVEAEITAQ